jgi:prolyl oligopeptidase
MRHQVSVSACARVLVVVAVQLSVRAQIPSPPPTHQDNVREVIHGVEIVDPYRWLEDQDSPETRSWIAAQNGYAQSLLNPLPMRERIYKRLMEMYRHESISEPEEENGNYFFIKRGADQDLWSIYVRIGPDGPDELLVDPQPLSPDHTNSVTLEGVSQDGKLLAYGVRRGGEDETEIHVFEVTSRQDLPDRLPRALYLGLSWEKDGRAFYYTRAQRVTGKRIYRHVLGTDSAQDPEIFGEGYGPDVWVSPYASRGGRYLLAMVQKGWQNSELFLQDLAEHGPFRPLVAGIAARFEPQFAGDNLIVQTDWQAPKSRLLKIDLRHPEPGNWREIAPAGEDAIQDFALIGQKVFVHYLHSVTSRIEVFSLDGQHLGQVSLPSLGSAAIYGRWGDDEGILQFSSLTTPYSLFRYSASAGKRELWYRDSVPFASERFETEQVWYTSKDGTRVPMFLVHRKGLKPNGQLPTLLHGYGGFDVSMTPAFNHRAAWWIEQDGLYALANIRGGGEFGEEWHRAGMLEKKQNVFDDFIAGAEWLIEKGYTNPDRLAIWGGSNGGLLMGAVLTQRPDLSKAVVCEHPDLDMVRYYKFTKNNNPPALLEYGNASDPAQFKFLYAYSPYQHVQPGTKYPAVLLTSGDADTRVPPQQARKMAARLQAATGSGRPVLLLYDSKAGHSGGKPLSKAVQDLSLELSFLAWQLAMK